MDILDKQDIKAIVSSSQDAISRKFFKGDVRKYVLGQCAKRNLSCMDFRGQSLENMSLCDVTAVASDFMGAMLAHADLQKTVLNLSLFIGADLRHCNFSKAQLISVNFQSADISYAVFDHCNLSGADLRKANLARADLTGAILQNSNIKRANLAGADLKHTDIAGANLKGANITNVKNLTAEQLRSAFNIDQVVIDDGDMATRRILDQALHPTRLITVENMHYPRMRASSEAGGGAI